MALARLFASRGLRVHGARRRPVPKQLSHDEGSVRIHAVDFRSSHESDEFVAEVERQSGPIELAVHNIGANVRLPLNETSERVYRKVWELAALSAFNFARAVGPRMSERGGGTMIFTGATASVRGSAGFSAFAGGMHAKRALAQSLARELGPAGVHVAHVVIDGPIDTPFVRELMGDEPFLALRAKGGLLEPTAIADACELLRVPTPCVRVLAHEASPVRPRACGCARRAQRRLMHAYVYVRAAIRLDTSRTAQDMLDTRARPAAILRALLKHTRPRWCIASG